jgi:hypothetical protein
MGYLPVPFLSVSATAQNLTTLLGLTQRTYLSQLTLRAQTTNAGTVFVGGSGVTTTVYGFSLSPGTSYTFGPFGHFPLNTDDIFLVGTSGDDVEVVATS